MLSKILSALLVFSFFIAHGHSQTVTEKNPTRATTSKKKAKITLFFVNENLPEFETTCGAVEPVTRKIPMTRRIADAALRQLFAGPTDKEKAKEMLGLAPLGDFYLGVSIEKNTAIVNFGPGAMKYLNGAACNQEALKTPVEKTLKQFKTVKRVEYAINGKVVEDWDA